MPGELPDSTAKFTPSTPLGELQGSPTPPPNAHEMMDPSMFQELPASPVPPDYFTGKGPRRPSRHSSRQSPLRRELSPASNPTSGGLDSLPISPLPSPIPSPPPQQPLSAPRSGYSSTAPSPPPSASDIESSNNNPTPDNASYSVPRTPSKPQQRPYQINLPHGSTPASPMTPRARLVPMPVPSIALHEPPSENSTLQQTPVRMKGKWKPLDYSGEGYSSDRD